ncbi:MAG: FliM/FliN family flagellar motor switch protein [Pseudomonadota bacterium]
MTVPKALRVALAKVADQSFGMALAVIGVAQERWPGDEIDSKLEADKLLLLLDGPSCPTGGVVLDSTLVSALVQQQTTGRVSGTPAADRTMTATDAALCAPLLDGIFQRAHGFLETPEDRETLPAYKFGARAENPRLFGLALGEAEYHVLRLTIDIAAGTAQSTLRLILPVPEPKPKPDLLSDASEEGAPMRGTTLERSVMGLNAELSAILCRVRLTLADISKLKPGDALQVPSDAFDKVELLSIEGRRIGEGAMGQVDGHRAMMLNSAVAVGARDKDMAPSDPDGDEQASDYANLNLPDLEIPPSPEMLRPGDESSIDGLPDLPDLPDIDDLGENPGDLQDLPDLPDLPGEVDHGEDLAALDALSEVKMA